MFWNLGIGRRVGLSGGLFAGEGGGAGSGLRGILSGLYERIIRLEIFGALAAKDDSGRTGLAADFGSARFRTLGRSTFCVRKVAGRSAWKENRAGDHGAVFENGGTALGSCFRIYVAVDDVHDCSVARHGKICTADLLEGSGIRIPTASSEYRDRG